MFLKPFRIKTNTQLKGSERKHLSAAILEQFVKLTDTDVQALIPQKEVINAIKIVTHVGEVETVYCVQKKPVIFEIDQVLYPSVYTLWTYPDLLPTFIIWPQVFHRLESGADLMLPGIALKGPIHLHSYGHLQKGEKVAVISTDNKAPVAVGITNLSSYDMYMAARHGKAVKILHVFGDELWSHGPKLEIPRLGPPEEFDEKTNPEILTDDKMSESVGHLSLAEYEDDSERQTGGSDDSIQPLTTSVTPNILDVEQSSFDNSSECAVRQDPVDSNTTENQDVTDENSLLKPEKSSQEIMDELILFCFLKALKTTAKKLEFPLLTSNFYKVHMIPACPPASQIDLKKSSYKKLSKFLNSMENLGIVKVKELTKGVESIMSVNTNHQMLKDFVDTQSETADETSDANVKKPDITELYSVTAVVLPVFSPFGLKKGATLTAAEVRKRVTEYVKREKLQDLRDKNLVTLNSALQAIVQNQNTTAVTWEDLMGLIFGRMTRSFQMTLSGQKPVAHKGKLEMIDIQIGKRTGNKKVTLINNLEIYGINIQEFSRECQHGVAASTSISSVPGKKSQQLLVQGNQVLFVGNLLMGKYQIPKRYIRGLELAPRMKK